jgi:hypothetical protein
MRLVLTVLAAGALLAAASPAGACPRRMQQIEPPRGGLLHEGDVITVRNYGRWRDLPAGEWLLASTADRVPLIFERDGSRLRLVPSRTLLSGVQYHLISADGLPPGWHSPLGVAPLWWVAAENDTRADLQALAARLALFGFLPFAGGYAVTRRIIVRRRRRAIAEL